MQNRPPLHLRRALPAAVASSLLVAFELLTRNSGACLLWAMTAALVVQSLLVLAAARGDLLAVRALCALHMGTVFGLVAYLHQNWSLAHGHTPLMLAFPLSAYTMCCLLHPDVTRWARAHEPQ